MSPRTDCSYFSGAKPCGKNQNCDFTCNQFKKRGKQILLIHLGALGAVVRSTALIKSIHRKYPNSQITWVTQSPAHKLLQNHPELHRVLTLSDSDLLALGALKFDVALVIDKSLEATGVLRKTSAKEVLGFVADETGVIHFSNEAAKELWNIGISDDLKFNVNKKTEIQLIHEALELDYNLSDYNLPLSLVEKDIQYRRHIEWSSDRKLSVVGINTGCAATIAAKKLSVENHRELIRKLQKNSNIQIVLLGGPEDSIRNAEIALGFHDVILSPTDQGLRDGLASVAACDIVVTGDSLGMHMAISQKKQVIAWFGPTCSHEIELYGRGEKIETQATCGPCWKRSCHKPVMCYDLVNLDEIINAVQKSTDKTASELSYSDGLLRGSALGSASFDLDEKVESGYVLGADLP